MFLDKAAILSKNKPVIEELDVPDWQGKVRIRQLTAKERDAFESSNTKFTKDGKPQPNLGNYRGRLACLAICQENGEPIFSYPDDADQLGELPARGLDVVVQAIQRLAGMREEDLDDAEKN